MRRAANTGSVKYNDKQLAKLKQTELDMLKCVLTICGKFQIPCFLIGGSALGAVRHGGMIPWDDDIDVGLYRKDYELFIEKAQELLPDHYFLQTFETDPQYPFPFLKIRDSRTTFIETTLSRLQINHGVYLDVFPLDYYPDKFFERIVFDIKNRLMKFRLWYYFNVADRGSLMKRILGFCGFCCSCVFYPTVPVMLRKREELYKKCGKSTHIANYGGAWDKKETVPEEWFSNGSAAVFDGMHVTVPKEYDKYLTHIYGDYMQFPPEEKRVPHHYLDRIDLEKTYKTYVGGSDK